MNDHYLINDEWVAIRSDPIKVKGYDKLKNNDSTVMVSWDNEKHLIELNFTTVNNDDSSKTASHTVNSLVCCHWQLKELFPEVDVDLPDVPMEPKGFWSYWSSWKIPENFEENFQNYLIEIKTIIGEQLFLQTYFESQSDEEYLENLNELNREVLLKNLHSAKALLDEVRCLRGTSINILDTLSIYDLEDEAQSQVDVEEAILYNFEQQPFLELRELARQKYSSLQKQLLNYPINEGDVCNKEKLRLSELCLECQKELKHYDTCLSDLQINYFEKMCASLESCCDFMVEDQKKYGDEFENSSGKVRYDQKHKELSKVSVQLLRLKKLKLLLKRESIKGEVCQLSEGEHVESDLNALEKKFYRTQMDVFELQMKILAEEENVYRSQLKEFHFIDHNNNKKKSDIDNQPRDGELSPSHDIDNQPRNGELSPSHDIDNQPRDGGLSPSHDIDNQPRDGELSPSHCGEEDERNSDSEDDFHDATEEQIEEQTTDQLVDDSDEVKTTDQLVDDNENQADNGSKKTNNESSESNVIEETSDIINQFLSAVTQPTPVTDNTDPEPLPPDSQMENHTHSELSEEDWKRKQTLVQALNRIFRKRAWLRNKQRKFVSVWKIKVDVKKKKEENYNRHHAIHIKREKRKADLEEKKEFLQEERRKTIARLKQYRKNYADEEKRPPARYALPIRRTRHEVKTVPFRPGGPALALPGTNISFRMMSDPAIMNLQKNLKPKVRVRKTNVGGKNMQQMEEKLNILTNKIDNAQQDSVETPPIPPPPPPALPPPPPPPPPPPMLTSKAPAPISHHSLNSNSKNSITFPIPPKSHQKSEKNTGIDLNSIINARSRLKKAKSDDDGGDKRCLNDVTASMLINALNKMKKYTSESADEGEDDDDGEFD